MVGLGEGRIGVLGLIAAFQILFLTVFGVGRGSPDWSTVCFLLYR